MLNAARQLLLVVAPGWLSRAARLQRFERQTARSDWRRIGPAAHVSLGRAGLAWGRGLHLPEAVAGRHKREGDGCSPAGLFAITALFGDAGPDSPLARAAKLPYWPATCHLKAIDDPASAHYNLILDERQVARPDWVSCEDMRRDDGRYAAGAVIAHNGAPSVPGAGSCIFLHVWAAAGVETAGCTAMALDDMREIGAWLDGAASPVLVQLPQAEYAARRAAWALPHFDSSTALD